MENPLEEGRGGMKIDHYNPVNVNESLGAIFLGLLTIILLIAYIRAQSRYTNLLKQTRDN